MRLKPKAIIPTVENPFEKDLLKREQYANVLSQIVKNSEGSFTLSINAPWGYGKTTFVKMWEASLQNEGYKTIYFNAWETDFVADPMMALIDGLRDGFESADLPQEKLQKLSALWDVIIDIAALLPTPNAQMIGGAAKAVKKGVCSLLKDKNQLQKHQSYRQLIKDFKDQLTELAKELSGDKQLIIFVDELDRCRPDYAVQMMERIKHFFEIDNIIFVLSIDKKVISESIKTVYGDIDVAGYLRRFVDLEFDLPEPEIDSFIEALYSQRLHEYILHNKSYLEAWNRQKSEIEIPFFLTKFLNSTCHRSLRDIEKYFNLLEIVLRSSTPNADSFIYIMYFTYMYIFNKDMYFTFKNRQYSIEQLWSDLITMVDIPYEQKDKLLDVHMSNILDIYTYYVADLKDSVASKKSDPIYLSDMSEDYNCQFINDPYREIV